MKTRPRVAHVQLGRGGGTERFFVNLVQAFAEAGSAQLVAVRDNVDYPDELDRSAEVLRGSFLRMTPGGAIARWRWRRAVEWFQPDAVIGWRAPTAKLLPRRSGTARIIRLGDYPSHINHLSGLDGVACNTPDIARHLGQLGYTGRVEIISNFVPSRPVEKLQRHRLTTPDDAFLICGSGRFAKNKGFDTLIRAAGQVQGAWLWLIGDGPERAALEALADRVGLSDRTRFTGWVPDPAPYLAAADCYVMPSRDEPLGNALLEAWQAGVPTVTTATAGPNWFAEDGRDCLMVDVGDPAGMAAAISRLRTDPSLATALVDGAAETLARDFSRKQVVERYYQLMSGI